MALKTLGKGKYKSPRGQLAARILEGSLAGNTYVIGDTDFVRNYTTENSERYTNEFAKKTLAYDEIDQEDVSLTITAYQAGKIAKMIAHMSEAAAAPETASAGLAVTVVGFDFTSGEAVVPLDARRVENVVVSDGDDVDPVIYEEGTDYTVSTGQHGKSYVNILRKPDLAGDDVVVDYDRLASSGDRYNLFSQSEILVELVYVENVKPAANRTAETHVYYRVGLKLEGDLQVIGSDSGPRTVTITGTCYYDDARQGFGHVDDNVAAAA